MKKEVNIIIIIVLFLFTGFIGEVAFAEQHKAIPYEQTGIRKTSLYSEIVVPPDIVEPQSAMISQPDRLKRYGEIYSGAPPQIPHSIKGFLPITQITNMCLNCHTMPAAKSLNTNSVPESHFINTRTGQKLTHIYYGMYNCSMCHTPQLNIQLPVENNFKKGESHE